MNSYLAGKTLAEKLALLEAMQLQCKELTTPCVTLMMLIVVNLVITVTSASIVITSLIVPTQGREDGVPGPPA